MKLDELKKMIEILRAAPEDQSEDYPVMTHSDVERLTFPCKLYQVDGYSEDMEAKVVEVTALAYNLADGATVKTVLFRREADRQRAQQRGDVLRDRGKCAYRVRRDQSDGRCPARGGEDSESQSSVIDPYGRHGRAAAGCAALCEQIPREPGG